ncbi:MAG: hypothetical protein E7410_07435 [Ruminococcaceae bacterium]|nr:hypothetical protein [Oscillospiraceae bacterium]
MEIKEMIQALSKLVAESGKSRDEARDRYKAFEKVNKSARNLLRDMESLQSHLMQEKTME